jgi:dTDP-4-dehydrorhamnose reductase
VRVLVTGAKGMLANALLPCLTSEHEVVGVDLDDFDISQESAVQKAFRDLRPEFVYHLAAYTDVDGCEANPQLAMQVNAEGTANLARSSAEVGATMLYVSTDYVFDGSGQRPWHEDDAPNPLSVYGKSKLLGEQAVAKYVESHLIARSSWLFGPKGKNFVSTILKLAAERDELRVVSDQRGSPTYTRHLALKLAELINCKAYGIYHVTGSGICSWFELTQAILKSSGFDRVRLVPISTQESARRAPRPAYSVLENRRLTESHLGLLPHWEEGLADYLREGQRLGEFKLPSAGSGEKALHTEVARS